MLEHVEKLLISWYYFCDKSFCEIEVSVSNVRRKNAETGFGYTGYRFCDYLIHSLWKKYEIVGIGCLANMKIGQEAAILYDQDDSSKAVMKKSCILCLLLPESQALRLRRFLLSWQL